MGKPLSANLKRLKQLVCLTSQRWVTYGKLDGKHQIFPVDNSLEFPQPSWNWLPAALFKVAKQASACSNDAMLEFQCCTLAQSSSLLLHFISFIQKI
jgi:hypothetical protein